ncbi:MAG: PIN domain-containing protein [Anaerolineales bacterium]
MPFSARHGAEVERLPRHHRDPFDLMLIAQSRVEGVALLTNDAHIARHDIDDQRSISQPNRLHRTPCL